MDGLSTVSSTMCRKSQKNLARDRCARSIFRAARGELAQFSIRARFDQSREGDAPVSRALAQRAPRLRARDGVVQIGVVHLGYAFEEDRICRIPRVERFEQRQRVVGPLLVPDVQLM